jgi:hypothetical protein
MSNAVRNELSLDFVQVQSASAKAKANAVSDRFKQYQNRTSTVSEDVLPSNTLGRIMFLWGKWKRGRVVEDKANMIHPSSNRFLVIEQIEGECGVAVRDAKAYVTPNMDDKGYPVSATGLSMWVDFRIHQDMLQETIVVLQQKGWELIKPSPKQQLELVDERIHRTPATADVFLQS